jgi:hypothetical protein
MGLLRTHRWGVAVAICATSLIATSAPATATVTIGQTGDPTPSECDPNFDFFPVSGPTQSSFVVPGKGTITTWTMFAGAAVGEQFKMKVFRKVTDPLTYQVVGHAGPETLTPGGTAGNTFPAGIRVEPGDILGLHNIMFGAHCAVLSPEWTFAALNADLADGQSQPFELFPGGYPDVQASFVPDNTFNGKPKVKRNAKKGTATITVQVPNPGVLTGSGGGAKVSSAAATGSKSIPAPGEAKLKVRAKGAKLRTLNQTGKVTLKLKLAYTPTGGDTHTQKLKLKLLKR